MNLRGVDSIVNAAIAGGAFPAAGYAVGIGRNQSRLPEVKIRSFGAACDETLWDLASLTKVVATTTAAMLLYDRGSLDLDAAICSIIPNFRHPGVTVRNLLLHDSGLPASHPAAAQTSDLLADIWSQELAYETGSQSVYSDVGFIVLGKVIESIARDHLDRFLTSNVWEPLGMPDTMFTPSLERRRACAPTEPIEGWRKALRAERNLPTPEFEQGWITGEVHDPTAMVLGGVAGHAGLFANTRDVARFAQMMLNRGESLVDEKTVDQFTTRGSPPSSRALGWDTPSQGSSAGERLGPRSFGHTGFTGTSLWIDPDLGVFAVLLTNRVHPTARNLKIKEVRRLFHDAVVNSVTS